MSLPNRNPRTGIRYGYISANSLDPEIVHELQMRGTDVHWEEYKKELHQAFVNGLSDYLSTRTIDVAYEAALEEHDFQQDEPVHKGEYQGVQYRTSWLGGALHVWVFYSDQTGLYQECSPCVPGAGNLDQPDENGVMTYSVPDDWRAWRDNDWVAAEDQLAKELMK